MPPPVVALDHTSIRMEMIYDPHRQIYFIPRLDVKNEHRDSDNNKDFQVRVVLLLQLLTLGYYPIILLSRNLV